MADESEGLGPQVRLWTPELTFATPGDLNVEYSSQLARYKIIGSQLVYATFRLITSTFQHSTSEGQLRITGLPVAAGVIGAVGTLSFEGITKENYTNFTLRLNADQTFLTVSASASAQDEAIVGADDVPSGGFVLLRGSILYFCLNDL